MYASQVGRSISNARGGDIRYQAFGRLRRLRLLLVTLYSALVETNLSDIP
ncbi:hypothetical protein [Cupriavidus sp. U2]|nr:hypothetical protein [Cupriavidus sp. U2]